MRTRWMVFIRALLLVLCGLPGWAHAADYSFYWGLFSGYTTNAPCTGNWSYSSSTFTCSGEVSLAAGDTLAVATLLLGDIVVVANGGFVLRGNTVGTSGKAISLQSSYSAFTATGTNTIYGSITSTSGAVSLATTTVNGSVGSQSGAVSLSGSSVTGTLTSSGGTTLTNSSVGGITRINSNLSASGSTFKGNVTVSSFTTLSASTLEANLAGTGEITAVAGTTIAGELSNSYGTISVSNGRVGGRVSGQTIVGNATIFSNDLTATSGTVAVTGGSVTGDISSNCCVIALTRTSVTGSVSATNNNIVLDGATVTGDLKTTNEVRLNDSLIYGNVTAATWSNSTITGTGSSRVYGICTPTGTTPADLCDGAIASSCLTSSADTFSRTTLGNDWAVTSRSGTFGLPRIVSGRLRLTDDSTEASTGATVQRLFPATNNLITITFKYYGYSNRSNRGADGVAVILSDASVTPQPGAFGGSLGYAQKVGISGFAGGWLGVGLDEFGNFSNATEGRIGGPGQRADSVSIRGSGSGTSGYSYLAGTGTLSTGVDHGSATTIANPGHLYRITIDSRSPTSAWVTVERDTSGSGNNYTTLVAAHDVRASSSQAVVPSNFMLSFTGSTGASVNIHELDDLQVCANRMNPVGAQIDHFEIVAPSTGLTCSPMDVTVRACLNAACNLYTETVTATATLTSGSTVLATDTRSFAGGTGSFSLSRPTVGTATLGIAGSTPAAKPLSQTLCRIGSGALSANCSVNFVDSGFMFDVPTQLSNKPSDTVLVQAVRKDDTTQRCVPAFQNVQRDLAAWFSYVDPGTGAGRVLQVNDINVSASEGAPTTLPLSFDTNAQASIKLRYNDAGKLQLNLRYTGSAANKDGGLVMAGTDPFVVKPVGFCVKPTAWSDTTSTTCIAGDAQCPVFVAAGDGFPVRFRPVGWESDTDSDLCVGNPNTPNFRHNNLALDSVLVAPSGGEAGTLSLSSSVATLDGRQSYHHQTTSSGYSSSAAEVVQEVKFSEVGVFRMRVTPANNGYLDSETVAGGISNHIGRVTPAYLDVGGEGGLADSCSNGLTYQVQPMNIATSPSLTLTGKSRSGATTTNYDRGAFWRFAAHWTPLYFSSSDRPSLDARMQASGQATSLDCSLPGNKANCVAVRLGVEGADGAVNVLDETVGDGSRKLQAPSALKLRYLRAMTPNGDDSPFDAKIEVFTPRAQLVDSDGIFAASPGATHTPIDYGFVIDGARVVLGRYRLAGAAGSELRPLSLPLYLEHWNGSAFLPETGVVDESCTTISGAVLDSATGNLSASKTSATVGAVAQGGSLLTLSAPGAGNTGSIRVEPQVLSWLHFDWLGNGAVNPSATATFGSYGGFPPLIFRREVYR